MNSTQNFTRQVFRNLILLVLLIGATDISYGQSAPKLIKGIVVDQDGETLPGVNVVRKGTSIGAITDFDGEFTITIAREREATSP